MQLLILGRTGFRQHEAQAEAGSWARGWGARKAWRGEERSDDRSPADRAAEIATTFKRAK